MLKRGMVWTLMMAFLFPIYSYADSTTVPDFKSTQECQTWVQDYAKKMDSKSSEYFIFYIWFGFFALSQGGGTVWDNCPDDICTVLFSKTGGCDMLDNPFLEDAWGIARRNLIDEISLYESKLESLPNYYYGKVCHFAKGTEYQNGTCWVIMDDPYQPCATLNALNSRLHIACLKVDNQTYWIEADLNGTTFALSSIGAGYTVAGHADDCATYTNGTIHIPCVDIGTDSYWVDLEVKGTNPIELHLTNWGKH